MKLQMHINVTENGVLAGTAALEEDAQILRVIEAYCTGASLHQSSTGACLCKKHGRSMV